MLKRINRLAKRKEFEQLFASGRAIYGRFLGLRFTANDSGLPKVVVIAGKKVSKKAVTRNRLKRQIREVIRLRLTSFNGLNAAIIVLPAATKATFVDFKGDLDLLLKKAKIS
ncbi:MAG: ribonuclease P protein component [Candidatus Falkowbacteria bacterium]